MSNILKKSNLLSVRSVPYQPHCFLYGGFDIQMVRTLESLRSVGVDARPLDFWDKEEKFDILHVWGLTPDHENIMRISKDYGKKVAMTPLLPYFTPARRIQKLAGLTKRAKQTLQYVDVLLVVNQLQAETAEKLYGFNHNSIEIIPTMLDPVFFKKDTDCVAVKKTDGYLISVGNILPRKNQVRLAKSALLSDVPIVFVGNEMAGNEAYTEEFKALVDSSEKLNWYRNLNWDELFRVINNASGVVVASFDECQPAAALEAIALQKPLLLADRPYAYQDFFQGALIVKPNSVKDIAKGMIELLKNPTPYTPQKGRVDQCRTDAVGAKLLNIFDKMVMCSDT